MPLLKWFIIEGVRMDKQQIKFNFKQVLYHESIFWTICFWPVAFLKQKQMRKNIYTDLETDHSLHSYVTRTNNQPPDMKRLAGIYGDDCLLKQLLVCRTFMRHESYFSSVRMPLGIFQLFFSPLRLYSANPPFLSSQPTKLPVVSDVINRKQKRLNLI